MIKTGINYKLELNMENLDWKKNYWNTYTSYKNAHFLHLTLDNKSPDQAKFWRNFVKAKVEF